MDLLIGCPVYKRAWIIEPYLEYADKAARVAGYQPKYFFIGSEWDQDDTFPLIKSWCVSNGRDLYLEQFDQDDNEVCPHGWGEERYRFMVELRNAMLSYVRKLKPKLFLSLDSDILLHPDAIKNAVDGVGRFDAIGMKVYLSPGTECPSYATFVTGSLHRTDFEGFAPVDVIMAAKLMTPAAYAVDYAFHHLGEDAGWAVQCREHAVKLGFDGRVASKHVMEPEQLYRFDHRIGW